jgi:hypothetical protein
VTIKLSVTRTVESSDGCEEQTNKQTNKKNELEAPPLHRTTLC